MPEFMTTVEVAEFYRTPEETVRYWRHRKVGPPSFKLGRRVLYRREDVLEWVEQQRTAEQPEPAA